MLFGSDIPELVNCIDENSIRVYAPAPVLLLCGGTLGVGEPVAPSLREAFTRVFGREPFSRYSMLLAEQVNAFFPDGDYRDILSFEADLAQISELIVLFSESYGSAAELGAFAMVEEIAKRLLVIIDDHNYAEKSFIRLGPVKSLELRYGDSSVCVLNRADLQIENIARLTTLDVGVLTNRLGTAIKTRGAIKAEHTTFDRDRPGHVAKLMVGLIQHYGSLYIDEIELFLDALKVTMKRERVIELLRCAEIVEWIVRDKRGLNTYYSARAGKDAMSYKFKQGIAVINKERWRALIVEHWKNADPDRVSSIQSAVSR